VRVEAHFDRLDVPPVEEQRLALLLDPAERERARRFRQAMHRRRFTVRRARLRQWLGQRLNLAPEAVPIVTDAMGKPGVPGWDRYFSASHSRDTMLIVGAPVPVGCDIEAIDPAFDWRPVADRLFAPEERRTLQALADEPGRNAFFQCWTRKEAFVKGLGQGLAHPLDAFAVNCDSPPALLRGGDGWSLAAIDLPGHAVAIAAKAPCDTLRLDVQYSRDSSPHPVP